MSDGVLVGVLPRGDAERALGSFTRPVIGGRPLSGGPGG